MFLFLSQGENKVNRPPVTKTGCFVFISLIPFDFDCLRLQCISLVSD